MAPKSGATRLTPTTDPLAALLTEIRACRICEEHLPLGPRPVVVATASARVLIAGQAPGTRVHESGVPWDDASGDRLREWLDLDRDVFYDDSRVAIVPQGFCYPGKAAGGDLPPRPECALTWHDRLLAQLPERQPDRCRRPLCAKIPSRGAQTRKHLAKPFARGVTMRRPSSRCRTRRGTTIAG